MCYTEEATLSCHYHPESKVYTGIHSWYGTSVGLDTYIMICIPHYGFPGGLVLKSWPGKQETWVQSPDQEDSPGEGNGNTLQYSGLEISWTEEPGGLQYLGSQRVRHNLATKKQQQQHTPLYY